MEAVKTGSAEDWIRECFNDCDFNFVDNEFMYSIMTDCHVSSSTDACSNYPSPISSMDMASPSCPDLDYGSSFEESQYHPHHHQSMHLPSCCVTEYPMDHKVLGVDLDLFQPEFSACISSSCSSPSSSSTSSSSPCASCSSSESMVLMIKKENEDHHGYTSSQMSNPMMDFPMQVPLPPPLASAAPVTTSVTTTTTAVPSTAACKSPNRKARRRKKSKQNETEEKTEDPSEKVFPCPYAECGNVYLKSSHLKVHIRRHTGEKPFKCTWQNCDWSFRRSDELSRHRRCHSGVKPYECSLCGKSFARSDHLSKHMKVHRRSGSLVNSRKDCDEFDDGTRINGTGRRRRHYMTTKPSMMDAAGTRMLQQVGRVIQVHN